MAQETCSNMLEVHVGSANGYLHDDKQPSFSTDTLLSSVQSADFSPGSDQGDATTASRSTSAASSTATKNLDHPSTSTVIDIDEPTQEFKEEQEHPPMSHENDSDSGKEKSEEIVSKPIMNGHHQSGTNGVNSENVMTTSANSNSSNSSGTRPSAFRFSTLSTPGRRQDSVSSSSTLRLKKSPLTKENHSDEPNSSEVSSSPQRVEDRLNAVKAARSRQEAERVRRLTELAEALKQQQNSYEQRRAEMRKMMEERRAREEEHRRAVEVRRRRLFEAEQARREAIIRKLEERDLKLRESRVKSAHFEGGFAFGSNAKLSADVHRAYSVANLRRGEGVRSASCDRHGNNSSAINSSLEKSAHRQSSTALASRTASSGGSAPNGVMSVSMICLSPSDKNSAPPAPTSTMSGPRSNVAARKSRKQLNDPSASHASLHQISGNGLSPTSPFDSQNATRMCASLVNIPEEEPLLTGSARRRVKQQKQQQQSRVISDNSQSASKRRLLASRASSVVPWQPGMSSRRTPTQSGRQPPTTTNATAKYNRYQPRPSSVPARRIRRDAPTMYNGAPRVVPTPPQVRSPLPRRPAAKQSDHANGTSEMTLTASVTAAIVPQPPQSRTASMRARSERQLNRLSIAPSSGDTTIKKTNTRHSMAPASKPSTPSARHPPTKAALLPPTPSAQGKSPAATPSSYPTGITSDRPDSTLDADAEKEYQRRLAEKRRQAREAAAAKAKAAEEKKAAEAAAVEAAKLAAEAASMARSAPPDIIASALDGDAFTMSSEGSSPQPQQSPASTSPESAIAVSEGETVDSSQAAQCNGGPTLSRDLTVVVSPAVIVTGENSMEVQGESAAKSTLESEDKASSNDSGSSSQSSSAAVSPPVPGDSAKEDTSGANSAVNTPSESRKVVRPISGELSGSTTRLQHDSLKEKIASLTGSQNNLMTTSLTTPTKSQAADDWAKKQEEERAERKKRLDAIMSRVKPTAAATGTVTNVTTPQQQLTASAHPALAATNLQPQGTNPSTNNSQAAESSNGGESPAINGSGGYTIPSADILLSKIKSEKVQSILANRLAASSGSKVRFNLINNGSEAKDENGSNNNLSALNNGIGASVPDLQASESPQPRNAVTTSSMSSAPDVTNNNLLMMSSNDDSTGTPTNDSDNDSNDDRKLDEVIRLEQSAAPAAPKQQPSVEAFVN